MPRKQKKEKFTTEKYLDKKLGETSQAIIKAVDFVLDKQLKGVKSNVSNLKEDIEIIKIDVKGLKKEMASMEERLGKKIDSVQTLIDGYVKAQEEFKQEFVIMKEELKQIKMILKQKLGVEIRAI